METNMSVQSYEGKDRQGERHCISRRRLMEEEGIGKHKRQEQSIKRKS